MNPFQQEYADAFRRAGLVEGDLVLIHSGLQASLRRDSRLRGLNVAGIFFDALRQAVGDEGTLVFPTFNFDFSNGLPYDIRRSSSQMGSLSEYARLQGEFRTGHAVYSFVAIGRHAALFRPFDNKSAYGDDSPFELIKQMRGKIAVLNLPDQNSMTFYHHVEQLLNVPYRYHKDFANDYTDDKSITSKRTYSIFVRDLDAGVVTDVNGMGELLWEKGIYTGDRPSQGCGLRVARAMEIFEATAEVIQSGRAEGLLFSRGD
jgi:aminoglycoside 3-N-acetyltransferase